MAKLQWDLEGQRLYETGISNCALFPWDTTTNKYGKGVAWNGISSVQESPSGADSNAVYADNIKYLDLRSAEEFGATIEAYTFPDEWAECDGIKDLGNGVYIGQQTRKKFCLVYKTILGNDTDNNDHGYKLHIIYGATASPSSKQYQTVNDSPEAMTLSWEISTTPISFTIDGKEYKTATVTIDSTDFTDEGKKAKLKALEDALYGTSDKEPGILMPDAINTLLTA